MAENRRTTVTPTTLTPTEVSKTSHQFQQDQELQDHQHPQLGSFVDEITSKHEYYPPLSPPEEDIEHSTRRTDTIAIEDVSNQPTLKTEVYDLDEYKPDEQQLDEQVQNINFEDLVTYKQGQPIEVASIEDPPDDNLPIDDIVNSNPPNNATNDPDDDEEEEHFFLK